MKQQTIKIIPYIKNVSLAQDYNTAKLEYALFKQEDNVYKQLIPWVLCKNFITDSLLATLHKKYIKIFGFEFDGTKESVDLTSINIILSNNIIKKFSSYIPQYVDFLNSLSSHFETAPTVVTKVFRAEKIAIQADPYWYHSPVMFEFFLFMLRIALSHKIGDSWLTTVENIYNRKVEPANSEDYYILTYSYDTIKNWNKTTLQQAFPGESKFYYPIGPSVVTYHNSCGIKSYSKGYYKKNVLGYI